MLKPALLRVTDTVGKLFLRSLIGSEASFFVFVTILPHEQTTLYYFQMSKPKETGLF